MKYLSIIETLPSNIMKLVIVLIILASGFQYSTSQNIYQKSYGNRSEQAKFNDGITTNDGGLILTGSFEDNLLLLKLNNSGDTLWTKFYRSDFWEKDIGVSVRQTSDDGYIVLANTYQGVSGYGIYLIKTDSLGDTLWTKMYTSNNSREIAYSIENSTDRGYIIYGASGSSNLSPTLTKLDSNGVIIWAKRYESNADGYYIDNKDFDLTNDGGYTILVYVFKRRWAGRLI